MLTGNPKNYVRILEPEYEARIAAAEARGRASVSTAPTPVISTTIPKPGATTMSLQTAATPVQRPTSIDAIPLACNHPALVTQLKASGASVDEATKKILKAEGERQGYRSDSGPVANAAAAHPQSFTPAMRREGDARNLAAQEEARVGAIKIRRYIGLAQTMEGRTLSAADAANEMYAQGLL